MESLRAKKTLWHTTGTHFRSKETIDTLPFVPLAVNVSIMLRDTLFGVYGSHSIDHIQPRDLGCGV